ncbi:MAG: glycerophosphodiester phosphodiesterase family protein, partial [Acidobacteria bacterium]|nr:glycerophosphodiester phosphodiesterase family protein [Acidobacteriota bacterium]
MNLASCRDPEDAVTKRVLLSVAVSLLTLNFAPGLAHPSSIQADDPEGPPGPGGLESADVQARPFEIQGHRGAKGLAPEHSIEAFEKAIALGVDTLEMDAQSTSDRVLVVHHGQKIDAAKCRRADGGASGSKLLKDLTLEEV